MQKRGYSLVEILVVLSIIGILLAIITVNISKVKAESRDKKRISDIALMELALAQYLDRNEDKNYPISFDQVVQLNLIPAMPTDPLNTGTYTYSYKRKLGGTGYCLGATLENSTNPYIDPAITQASCPTDNASNNFIVEK